MKSVLIAGLFLGQTGVIHTPIPAPKVYTLQNASIDVLAMLKEHIAACHGIIVAQPACDTSDAKIKAFVALVKE